MTDTHEPFEYDLGDDLRILRTTRRASGGGTWVAGTIDEFRFDALVFPEHAENPDWELGESRISKLSVAASGWSILAGWPAHSDIACSRRTRCS